MVVIHYIEASANQENWPEWTGDSKPVCSYSENTALSLSSAVHLEYQRAVDFFLLFFINKLIFIGAELLYNVVLVLLYRKVNHLFVCIYPLFLFLDFFPI